MFIRLLLQLLILGFNPCFSGSCIRIFYCYSCRGYLWFQSLFQWILHSNFAHLRRIGHDRVMFQSLFQWILHSNTAIHAKAVPGHLVSILVLVDLAFEYSKPVAAGLERFCFNPCFSGSCIRIKKTNQKKNKRKSFNPCFSGSCIRIGQKFPLFGQKRPEMSPFSELKFLLVNYQTLYKYKKNFIYADIPVTAIYAFSRRSGSLGI